MTARLHRRTGFEIELMAPPGLSRQSLARDLADRCGGRVHPVWHHDSEPSLVPGLGRFLHLTQGFEVRKPDGTLLCTLVDDITLMADLNPRTPPPPGWFRILSDDRRLLRLLALHSDPVQAFDAYERTMRPFVEANQALAIRAEGPLFLPRTREELQARERMLASLTGGAVPQQSGERLREVYGALQLPRYPARSLNSR